MFQQQAVVPPLKIDDAVTQAKMGQKPNLLIWILGGVALLLVIGVTLLAFRGRSRSQTASQVAEVPQIINPDNPDANNPDKGKENRDRAAALKAEKRYAEAEAEYREAIRLYPEDEIALGNLGILYAEQGKRTEALQIITDLKGMSGAIGRRTAEWIAKIYATLNEKDQAFEWLERGYKTQGLKPFNKDDPAWDSIRSDPRFTDLLRHMGTR